MTLNAASFALDTQGTSALRAQAARDPKAATKEAAKQFEALFMNEVMKRMRAATLESGLMENRLSTIGTEMLDQQFANQMTGLPGGLSAAIERQLSRGLQKTEALSSGGLAKPAGKRIIGHCRRYGDENSAAQPERSYFGARTADR